jgi:hypothetical protein
MRLRGELRLQRTKQAFGRRVVVAIARPTHAAAESVATQQRLAPIARVLRATIRVGRDRKLPAQLICRGLRIRITRGRDGETAAPRAAAQAVHAHQPNDSLPTDPVASLAEHLMQARTAIHAPTRAVRHPKLVPQRRPAAAAATGPAAPATHKSRSHSRRASDTTPESDRRPSPSR